MSTVSNTPVPPKTVAPKSNITSDSVGKDYWNKPTQGGNSAGQTVNGRPVDVPPGVVPGAGAYSPNLAGNAFSNPTIDGAKIVANNAQPDATGHPAGDTSGGGTVGDSGPGLGQ
jgi:hypothetical protein